MTVALAQSFIGGNGTMTSTTPFTLSLSVTIPNNITAGNCLVVFATATTTASSLGNREFPSFTPSVPGGAFANWYNGGISPNINIASPISNRCCAIWYLQNCPSVASGNSVSVPVVFNGSGVTHTVTAEFAVYEFSGVATNANKALVTDVAHAGSGTSSTPSTANLATTVTDLILVGFNGDTGNLTAGSGYTLGINMTTATFGSLQYILNQASGSIATAFTGTESNWAAGALALKAATATPIGGIRNRGFFFN